MPSTLSELVALARSIYGTQPLPKKFQVAAAVLDKLAGRPVDVKALGTTTKQLERCAAAPMETIFRTTFEAARSEQAMMKARRSLGQMLVGVLAERAFEKLYKTTVGTQELQLEDSRGARTDTDYRVLNGSKRQVFRINIKFFGTPFKRAQELVGLDPSDCFALATYKIKQALDKQKEERLPYIFAIVGVPQMTGSYVGQHLPEPLVRFMALVLASKTEKKRDIEDQVVRHLIEDEHAEQVRTTIEDFARQIEEAEWRVLSARRADNLLHKKLFERVYALRVRGFTMNYGRAEVDMHFSLREDLTPLKEFLTHLRVAGVHGVAVRLERGEI